MNILLESLFARVVVSLGIIEDSDNKFGNISRVSYLQQNVRKLESNIFISDKCREHFFPSNTPNPDLTFDAISLLNLRDVFVIIV